MFHERSASRLCQLIAAPFPCFCLHLQYLRAKTKESSESAAAHDEQQSSKVSGVRTSGTSTSPSSSSDDSESDEDIRGVDVAPSHQTASLSGDGNSTVKMTGLPYQATKVSLQMDKKRLCDS